MNEENCSTEILQTPLPLLTDVVVNRLVRTLICQSSHFGRVKSSLCISPSIYVRAEFVPWPDLRLDEAKTDLCGSSTQRACIAQSLHQEDHLKPHTTE